MCFGMEISLVLIFLLCRFESTVYIFLRLICFDALMIIKVKGFLPYVNMGNRYVNVACQLTYYIMLIRKTFKNNLYQLFFDLKTSVLQLKEREGFLFNL